MDLVRPRLLFATIAAGGGHVATARAMMQALEVLEPGRFDMEISDYMAELGRGAPAVAAFDECHKSGWRGALRRPWMARIGQRLIDLAPRLTVRTVRAMLGEFAHAAACDLAQRRIDLVVCNHGLLASGLALARRRHGVSVPVLTFATETHNISAYWADPWSERILAPTAEVAERLRRMGVPAERIETSGYPVQQSFLQAPPRKRARADLGLDEHFTVLVSLGLEARDRLADPLVRALTHALPDARIVVMCGRNDALRESLARNAPPKLRLEGFTDRMATFVAAADALVGKSGPASTYEALAVGRPLFVTSYVGRNEYGIVRMLERRGLGGYAPDPVRLAALLDRLHRDPTAASAIEERCRQLDLPGQTERLARRIADYAASS